MPKCRVHGGRTKPGIKHLFIRLNEQKSFISSFCTITANIKCTFWQVSILENRFSGKCPFGQMYILESVRSGKCNFWKKYIQGNVHSVKCTFREMYIRDNVLSRGHILKSLALASKLQVLENCPVLGSRTALFLNP